MRNTERSKKFAHCGAVTGSTSWPGKSNRQPTSYSALDDALKDTLNAVGVYGRNADLVGSAFALKVPGCRNLDGEALPAGSLSVAATSLERIRAGYVVGNKTLGPSNEFRPPHLLFKISVHLLIAKSFRRQLAVASVSLIRAGYKVSVAVGSNSFLFVREYRKLRQAMFELADCGVDFILENPLQSDELPLQVTALERAFSAVSVTPQWLGIHQSEDELDLSTYMAAVSRLGSLIHEKNKYVIYDGVSNDWQHSFVTSLPVSFYVSSDSSNAAKDTMVSLAPAVL